MKKKPAYKTKEEIAKYHREVWYPKNKERRLQLNNEWKNKQKQLFEEYRATLKCAVCQENDPVTIDFHHLDPTQKDFDVTRMKKHLSHARLMEEVNKCVPLCSNCHRKVHAGKITLSPSSIVSDVPLL